MTTGSAKKPSRPTASRKVSKCSRGSSHDPPTDSAGSACLLLARTRIHAFATSFGGPDSPRATAPWLPSLVHRGGSDGDHPRYELDRTYGLPKRFAFPEAK